MTPVLHSNHYLRRLFDRTHIAILVANDDATYVDANQGACRLLCATVDQIVGHSIADFIRPEFALNVQTQWRAFLRDGEQSGLFEMRRVDGTFVSVGFYAEANFVPGFHCSFLRAVDPSSEGFGKDTLTMCAWTKRVWNGQEWVSIEAFLQHRLNLRIAHGMSPQAYHQFIKPAD